MNEILKPFSWGVTRILSIKVSGTSVGIQPRLCAQGHEATRRRKAIDRPTLALLTTEGPLQQVLQTELVERHARTLVIRRIPVLRHF
jgi:hypothetical protein